MTDAAAGTEDRETTARLVGRLSHQLGNPLAVIVGYAELVGSRDDERIRKEAAAQIAAAAETLRQGLDQLLTLLALELGTVTLALRPVPLAGAVEAAIEALRTEGTSSTFVARASGDASPIVTADEEQLRRLLANVLLGATESSRGGGEVGVAIGRRDGFAELALSPSAADVPEPAQAAGVELYVARRLLELHGGALVLDAPSRSGTLTVRIPLAPEDAP